MIKQNYLTSHKWNVMVSILISSPFKTLANVEEKIVSALILSILLFPCCSGSVLVNDLHISGPRSVFSGMRFYFMWTYRWCSGKESACQCRKHDLWIEKIPWRRKWQPIPVLLTGKSHGQKSLAKLQESDMT